MARYEDVAQLRRAVLRYRRFMRLKLVLSVLWFIVCVALSVAVLLSFGILWALLAFFVGVPILTAVVTPLITLPVGLVVCGGRDAMRLGGAIELAKNGNYSALEALLPDVPEDELMQALA